MAIATGNAGQCLFVTARDELRLRRPGHTFCTLNTKPAHPVLSHSFETVASTLYFLFLFFCFFFLPPVENTRFMGPCACCRSRRRSHHQRVWSACCDIAPVLIYSSMDGVPAHFVMPVASAFHSYDTEMVGIAHLPQLRPSATACHQFSLNRSCHPAISRDLRRNCAGRCITITVAPSASLSTPILDGRIRRHRLSMVTTSLSNCIG